MTRIALAQVNLHVGALRANAQRILDALDAAAEHAPDLVVFPELTLAGYPPEDLLLRPAFLDACAAEMAWLVERVGGTALIGHPRRDADGRRYNSAALVRDGNVLAVYDKCLLPNYSVFDEERYFARGGRGLLLDLGTHKAGVVICEDAWEEGGPADDEAAAGAEVILCLSASPYHRGKRHVREETFRRLCCRNGTWFLYGNLVGGQDELVFDGGSLVMDPHGTVVARAREFAEDLLVFDLPVPGTPPGVACERSAHAPSAPSPGASPCPHISATDAPRPVPPSGNRTPREVVRVVVPGMARNEPKPACPVSDTPRLSEDAEVYGALCLGLGDYIRKNGFRGCVIGLSGGIDSALTAAVAVDALGAGQVIGVTMPSRYSAGETRSDAEQLARNLGIRFETLPIKSLHTAAHALLDPVLETCAGDPEDLTDQNLQARLRGLCLMALSNKFGMLVVNTSNKSESAVGYGTLYGDMVGGFAAIKDVLKTQVWSLSRHVNERHGREVIPVSTIERVPTAELRPGQEDRQSLPDYPVLDPILALYVERDMGMREIVGLGHDAETVSRVVRLVDRAEFKRRQSVPGTRITPKAFGKDRRMPITNAFE